MIHLRKDLCGYSVYTCQGIKQMSELSQPVCDNKNYDLNSDSRSCDNNFLNLPREFRSVVQNVSFVDLGQDAIWDEEKCVTDYTPLQGNAIDAFASLQKNDAFIAAYGDYSAALQCYSNSSMEQPGILLPAARLSDFSIVPLQAVPTASLAAAVDQTGTSRGIKSGCQAFCVTAKATGSYKVTFSVTGGYLYVSTDSSGQPVAIAVDALTNEVCQDKQDVESIAVYAIAGFDVTTGTWKGVLDWTSHNNGFYQTTPTHWVKKKQIATIKYVNRQIIDVIQSECSPIDLRDWVSEQAIPFDDGNYVFVYKGNSAQKEWVEVRDC